MHFIFITYYTHKMMEQEVFDDQLKASAVKLESHNLWNFHICCWTNLWKQKHEVSLEKLSTEEIFRHCLHQLLIRESSSGLSQLEQKVAITSFFAIHLSSKLNSTRGRSNFIHLLHFWHRLIILRKVCASDYWRHCWCFYSYLKP